MLPNTSMPRSPMPGGQAPSGQPPMGQPPQGGGQGADQGQVVEAIKQVLTRVKALADQNGIDFMSIVNEMASSGSKGKAPMPPPPVPSQPPM